MANTKVNENILELIGNTPMVKLNQIAKECSAEVYAKVEAFNPGHSAKDRMALYIIEEAERQGKLKPGFTIVETTSGNTGFSVAMVAIIKGYQCILAVSSKTNKEKIDYLRALGAKVFVCPANVPVDDPRSYYEVAKNIQKRTPNSIYINQYFNASNIDAHYYSTGPEIWKQTNGEITHLIACSGTGGTISGAGRYLKEKNPNIKIIGVDAYGSVLKKYHETGELDKNEIYPYRIEGLGKNLIPKSTDFNAIDEFEKVTDKDAALTCREIAKQEGLFVGYTSGAAFQGFKQIMKRFTKGDKVVIIFPDHGSRYMTKVYSDDWMKEQGFLDQKTTAPVEQVTNI